MIVDRRTLLTGAVAATAAAPVCAQTKAPATGLEHLASSDPTETIDLWPSCPTDRAPLPVEGVRERSRDPSYNDRYVFGISRPRMSVFRPMKPDGSAVLIMPGGGYRWVVIDKEGYEMARLLAERGVTAFVLFYRLPGEGWASGPDTPLADAQRAMRLIRHRAGSCGVDPSGSAQRASRPAGTSARACSPGMRQGPIRRWTSRPFVRQAGYRGADYPVISMTAPTAHAVSRAKLIGENATPAIERANNPALTFRPMRPRRSCSMPRTIRAYLSPTP